MIAMDRRTSSSFSSLSLFTSTAHQVSFPSTCSRCFPGPWSLPLSLCCRGSVCERKTPLTGWTNQVTKRGPSHTCGLTLAPPPELWGQTCRLTSSCCCWASPGNEPWTNYLWTHKQAATQRQPFLACLRLILLLCWSCFVYLYHKCIQPAHLEPKWVDSSSGLCLISTLPKLFPVAVSLTACWLPCLDSALLKMVRVHVPVTKAWRQASFSALWTQATSPLTFTCASIRLLIQLRLFFYLKIDTVTCTFYLWFLASKISPS